MPRTTLRVRLTPRGGRSQIVRREGEVLHIRVSAPPVDGKANKALLELLADALSIPKSSLTIQSGATRRDKRLEVEGLNAEEMWDRLKRHADSTTDE